MAVFFTIITLFYDVFWSYGWFNKWRYENFENCSFNKVFFNSLNNNRPHITLKIASTADGKIATKSKKSKWITNSVSRQHGHMLRAQNDCMLVGKGTIINDNPSLDCRLSGLESLSPDLFILDSCLSIPSNYKIYTKPVSYTHLTLPTKRIV